MLKVFCFLIFATVIVSADYVSLKKCQSTGDKTPKSCGETCMAMKEYDPRYINRGDFVDLRRIDRILTSRIIYTKSNKSLSWWYNDDMLKWVKNNVNDIKVSAFFVPHRHNMSRPAEATCCGISLTQKTCKISDNTEKGKLYVGLRVNQDMFGTTSMLAEFDSTPVATCKQVMNETYGICSQRGIIMLKKVAYRHTVTREDKEDVFEEKVLANCTYTISRDAANKFGVKLGQHIAKIYFNRQIWNITGYHSDTQATITNCSKNSFEATRNVTLNISEDDLVCYLYGTDLARADYFCMSGKDKSKKTTKQIETSGSTDIAFVVGLSFLGLGLLLAIICLGQKFGQRGKNIIVSCRKNPENNETSSDPFRLQVSRVDCGSKYITIPSH